MNLGMGFDVANNCSIANFCLPGNLDWSINKDGDEKESDFVDEENF